MPSTRWASLSLCVPLLVVTGRPRPAAPPDGFEQVFEELRRAEPRADRVAAVRDLVLRRDVAEFRLAEGTVALLTDVGGRTVGAVFAGRGAVSFTPPLAVERAHLERVLRDTTVTGPITAAVFWFADSTLAELERAHTFGSGEVPPGAGARVNAARDFLVEARERWVDPTFMTALMNGEPNGYFAGYVQRERGEDVMIQLDPHQVEEVFLLRRGRQTGQRVEVVCQFQRAEHLRGGLTAVDEKPEPLELESYRVEAAIAPNLDFSAAVVIRLSARRDSARWVPFILFSELDVDSVLGSGGAPLAFFRQRRTSGLWVRFDPPLRHGVTDSVRVVYHGDVIEPGSIMEQFLPSPRDRRRLNLPAIMDRWFFIKSTSTWFPRYSSWQAAGMDLTFRTPARYAFSSIGRLAQSSVEGAVRTTRWVTELPTNQASFNLGNFQEFTIADPRIPPVTVHMNAEAHRYMNDLFLQPRDPQQQVGGDLANSLSFFSTVFGPPLFQQYYASEIPYSHGQAFPGMIHLSWWTFTSPSTSGWEEIFRAHEMAHQWWGIGVEPADYRDVWLSEGFATFAGLWYMQLILRDNEKYFKQLREWRDDIRRVRAAAPPISLGSRAYERDPEHYALMVYRKGGWVLHMLRNMMMDLRTMDESRFRAMMQDFYGTYRGRRASTQDFQRVVEAHFGMPMDWFFLQWVDRTAIPTYILSWRAEPTADGKHLLRLRVRQEDVPESFVMPVPLTIHFADGDQAVVRVNVRGAVTEAELPLPARPTRLELNPFESVLAEVKDERWREG